MYFWDAVLVVARRWYVVVPGLALTVAAAVGVGTLVPPTYQATGAVLFLAEPTVTGKDRPTNPYLNFGPPLAATADVVAQLITADPAKAELAAAGGTGKYAVGLSSSSPAPMLSVVATDADPGVAVRTMRLVVERVQRQLADIQQQAGAPPGTLITATVITASEKAERLGGSRLRAMAGVGGLGLVASLFAAFLVESLARRRTGRRRQADPGRADLGHAAEPGPAPEPGHAAGPDATAPGLGHGEVVTAGDGRR